MRPEWSEASSMSCGPARRRGGVELDALGPDDEGDEALLDASANECADHGQLLSGSEEELGRGVQQQGAIDGDGAVDLGGDHDRAAAALAEQRHGLLRVAQLGLDLLDPVLGDDLLELAADAPGEAARAGARMTACSGSRLTASAFT